SVGRAVEFPPSAPAEAARGSTARLAGNIGPPGIYLFSSPHGHQRLSPPALARRFQSCFGRRAASTGDPAIHAAVSPAGVGSSPQFRQGRSFPCSPVQIFQASPAPLP